jgi:hypothetical protein
MTARPAKTLFGLAAVALLAGVGPAAAQPVTIQYSGTVVTVSGTPFGFTSAVRTAPITGSFTYDTRTADTSPADTTRGNYPHTTFPGAFSAVIQGTSFTGSATPFAQVENLNPDTFRFEDGPSNGGGIMSVNGTPNALAALFIAMTDSAGGAFSSDALPATFPFAQPPLVNGSNVPQYPHTFSLSDNNGTLLMQLNSINIQPVPEPSSLVLVLVGPGLMALRRRFRSARPTGKPA